MSTASTGAHTLRRYSKKHHIIALVGTIGIGVAGCVVTSPIATAENMCRPYAPDSSEQLSAAVTGSSSNDLLGSSDLGSSFPRKTPSRLPSSTKSTKALYQFTGPDSPDQTEQAGLSTTDLGIMWDSGDGRTLIAFGDSFRCVPGQGEGWHSNALFYSHSGNPARGFRIDGVASGDSSSEFLPQALHRDGVEMTKIPTAGIHIDGVQYVDFMSIKKWGKPGQWTTNYAQTVQSRDGGKTWKPSAGSTRTNTNPSNDPRVAQGLPNHVPGVVNFQLTAFVQDKNDSKFVYVFGTPNGRHGAARLARIPTADFPSWDTAEFWTGSSWSTKATDASPVIDGRVSEMHVHFNKHLGRWVAMYENASGIVLRQADSLEDPWEPAKTVISRLQSPDIYGAFPFPQQSGKDLYFVATQWSGYNPTVFRTDLDQL